jgi:hypothetical protein
MEGNHWPATPSVEVANVYPCMGEYLKASSNATHYGRLIMCTQRDNNWHRCDNNGNLRDNNWHLRDNNWHRRDNNWH